MENMSTPQLTKNPQQIANRFAAEAARGLQFWEEVRTGERARDEILDPPLKRDPEKLEDFNAACQGMLTIDELLPEALLKKRVEYIMQNSKLKMHFPVGFKVIPAIIPFSDNGYPMDEEETTAGHYLRWILVDPNGPTVNGFSSTASYVSDFLPEEIKDSGFTIGKYDEEGLYSVTQADRERLAAQYTTAFRTLQGLIA